MPRQVEITTGSRLHFGLLSHAPGASTDELRASSGRSGREFGGAGLMIDRPGFRLCALASECDLFEGEEPFRSRAADFVDRYRSAGPSSSASACRIRIEQVVPMHVGLGSGTQLGMAVARAMSLLEGDAQGEAIALARRVGRGRRSALGIHGFQHGGFLVDGGRSAAGQIGPLVARADFPAEWRFLLVTPRGEDGLAGEAEADAFARLPGMPQSITDRLCRLVLMELLPSVLAADFHACGEALHAFNRVVGEYFAPVQGGVYRNPLMRELVVQLRDRGVAGVGQTSWGPTIFALFPNQQTAEELAAALSTDERWNGCQIEIAAPLNTAAVARRK